MSPEEPGPTDPARPAPLDRSGDPDQPDHRDQPDQDRPGQGGLPSVPDGAHDNEPVLTDPLLVHQGVAGRPAAPVPAGREAALGVVLAVVVAASGFPLGALWSWAAPWTPAVMTQDGAVLAQPESEQLIAQEGWYLIITASAGLLLGVLAWILLRRYRGVVALVGLTLGAGAGGYLTYWSGHHIGRAHTRHLIASAPVGTRFPVPVDLRVQHHGLWHGFLPYITGDLLAMAIVAAVAYLLAAGFSPYPGLRPPPTTPRVDPVGQGDAVPLPDPPRPPEYPTGAG